MKESLEKDFIIQGLKGSIFSKNIHIYEIISSTNTLAKEMATKGAPHGTVVLAEEQTAGKGRLDRRWLSRGHENLLFTILLRPQLDIDKIFVLTMSLAIAAIDAIKEMIGLRTMIKWPNDLYINRKKLGGILTEFSVKDSFVEYVIIGLGMNINWMPDEENEILYPATSILAETGVRVSRNELLIDMLKRFERYYEQAISGETDALHKRWNELSLVIGNDVEIISSYEVIKGRAVSIDREGALILKNTIGDEIKILSGDVSLRF